MVEQVKPPNGLGAAGRQLWRQVVREAAADGLVLDAREKIWLESAAKCADFVARLEAEMEGEEMVVPGYKGQPVAHPLLTEIRQFRLLISQTLARIKVVESADGPLLGIVGTNKHRGAANRRWRGPGA